MHVYFAKWWVLSKVVTTWSRFARIKFQPTQPGKILPYDYMGEPNFILARQDSFSHGICFDLFTFSFNFYFCKHVLNYFFILLRWAEAITWKYFVPEKQDLGSTKKESRLIGTKLFHVIVGYNLWRIFSTAGKRDRISSR